MEIQQIALLSQTSQVAYPTIERVAEALNWQVNNDLGRLWGISVPVRPVQDVNSVPADAATIAICDSISDPNAYGFHKAIQGYDRPYALIRYSANTAPSVPPWTIDASHECLEMLVDPLGESLHPLPFLVPNIGQVDYLIEVCDPCGRANAGYLVGDVIVSDFCTRSYYQPSPPSPGGYTCQNRLPGAFGLQPGGYYVWCQRDASNQPGVGNWYMTTYPGGSQYTTAIPQPNIYESRKIRRARGNSKSLAHLNAHLQKFAAAHTPELDSSTAQNLIHAAVAAFSLPSEERRDERQQGKRESTREYIDRLSRNFVTQHARHPKTRKKMLSLAKKASKAAKTRQRLQRERAKRLKKDLARFRVKSGAT